MSTTYRIQFVDNADQNDHMDIMADSSAQALSTFLAFTDVSAEQVSETAEVHAYQIRWAKFDADFNMVGAEITFETATHAQDALDAAYGGVHDVRWMVLDVDPV